MSAHRPPTIDPRAAQRWLHWRRWTKPVRSPWLHEEVARRMESRLQFIVPQPQRWLHWSPVRGGLQVHASLVKRYPKAAAFLWEECAGNAELARASLIKPWWSPQRWMSAPLRLGMSQDPVQMLWANMVLHMHADPQALIAQWHKALDVDGFLMFSCLGPDTLRELRAVYAHKGWPAPAHQFTDMHDWGDMLMRCGFAEPIMDMQRIVLTFTSAESLLLELRELGRNLHVQRFSGLRGKNWKIQLHDALRQEAQATAQDGTLSLTFEIIYGHAFKPKPRVPMQAQTNITLAAMRTSLRHGKNGS